MAHHTELNTNFIALTPSKQRAYCEYISEAKRAVTKQMQLENITPMILKGIGLHYKYKNC